MRYKKRIVNLNALKITHPVFPASRLLSLGDTRGEGAMGRMFAAAVVLALAGCGSPAPYSAPTYTPNYSSYQPPPAPKADDRSGIWRVDCKGDKLTDKKTCDVTADLSYTGANRMQIVVATLSYSAPSGAMHMIVAPRPLLVRLRVDSAAPVTLQCILGGICNVPPGYAAQMARGSMLMVDIKGLSGGYPEPQTFSLSGFEEMRQAAGREALKR
jgi:hypothetical protein